MAFILTSDITIGADNVKANKVTWKTDVNSFTDTCTIDLPRIIYLENENSDATPDLSKHNNLTKPKNSEGRKVYKFKAGDKVSVSLGYNRRNEKRFEGFVRRVNMGVPVQLECEGYAYQLTNKMFNKTYESTTVKQILQDVTAGTDIVLSKEIPDIPLKNVRFKNATGLKVLEWFKNECKLSVYFNFNEIFVGTKFGKVEKYVKVRIGWNTVKDDDFKQKDVEENINIVIREKNPAGEVKKVKSEKTGKVTAKVVKPKQPKDDKYDNEKTVKVKAGMPAKFMQEIANRLQTKENYKGYEGNIVLFLEPLVRKGMVMELDGGKFSEEKSGQYFIEAVSGEFGESGGRQTVQLGFIMN